MFLVLYGSRLVKKVMPEAGPLVCLRGKFFSLIVRCLNYILRVFSSLVVDWRSEGLDRQLKGQGEQRQADCLT